MAVGVHALPPFRLVASPEQIGHSGPVSTGSDGEAERALELRAESGDAEAKREFGKVLLKRDRAAGNRWLEEAARDGDWWAAGKVADLFLRRHPLSQSRHSRRYQELMALLDRASKLGDAESMYTYGHRLVIEGKRDEGLRWLSAAAQAGIDPAKQAVAYFTCNGQSCEESSSASRGSILKVLRSNVRYGLPRRSKPRGL